MKVILRPVDDEDGSIVAVLLSQEQLVLFPQGSSSPRSRAELKIMKKKSIEAILRLANKKTKPISG